MVGSVSPRDRMSKWMREFVETVRSGYGSMIEEERRFISNLDDFSKPCQIDVFWFQPPDAQYVIVTHFADRPDLEINVNGPIPAYEAVSRLESILEESRWSRPLPSGDSGFLLRGESGTFRDIVDSCFIHILRDLPRVLFRKPTEKAWFGQESMLATGAFIWYPAGDMLRQSPSEYAQEIVNRAKLQAKAPIITRDATSPSKPSPAIQGHGSFIFPPVWIGDEPKPTFRERAVGGWLRFPPRVFEGNYRGRLVLANDDGFVAIGESDRAKATMLLNEIMAVRLLDGRPTFSFREQEVEPATIDPVAKQISSYGVPSLSLRASLMEERWSPPRFPIYGKRDVLSVDQFRTWIIRADRIAQDPELADLLSFLLEAYTHFEDSRYMESFVLSWVVVEKHLYAFWKRFLKEEMLPRLRRDKLANPGNWTIDFVIESLSLLKKITPDEYSKLISMKGLRNDIIHEGERVSKEQAEQVLDAATQVVTRRVSLLETQLT